MTIINGPEIQTVKEVFCYMSKDYYGKCGMCVHCDLSSGYTFCYSTSFKCTRNGYSVKADEKPCNRFELDRSRTVAKIEKYDK